MAVGFGFLPNLIALTLFAIPPILANAYVGTAGVDRDVTEAARGMGMSGGQVLRRVQVPLAMPLIAAGIRTATVQVIATATGGVRRERGPGPHDPRRLRGARPAGRVRRGVLVALLALAAEAALGRVQRRLSPGARPVRPGSSQLPGGPAPGDHVPALREDAPRG